MGGDIRGCEPRLRRVPFDGRAGMIGADGGPALRESATPDARGLGSLRA